MHVLTYKKNTSGHRAHVKRVCQPIERSANETDYKAR